MPAIDDKSYERFMDELIESIANGMGLTGEALRAIPLKSLPVFMGESLAAQCLPAIRGYNAGRLFAFREELYDARGGKSERQVFCESVLAEPYVPDLKEVYKSWAK